MTWISKIVKDLNTKYQTSNPFELADYLGYILIPYPFKRIRGMLLVVDEITIIGYSARLPRRLRGLVVYHEIAHRLLHRGNYFILLKNTFFIPGKFESQADRFVAELVMSEQRPMPGESVYEFAARHEIPVELVEVAVAYTVK